VCVRERERDTVYIHALSYAGCPPHYSIHPAAPFSL